MKNLICLSTGSVYKISPDMNKKINMLKQFNPQGIELCFAFAEDLLNFQPSDENLAYLRGLQRTSIHAPWKGIQYGENSQSRDVLTKLTELYQLIGARVINVHKPEDGNLSCFRSLADSGLTITLENEDWRKDFLRTPEQVAEELQTCPYLGLTFDFAHALSLAPTPNTGEAVRYLAMLQSRIKQVHVSYLDQKLKDHWFLHRHDSAKIRAVLKLFKPEIPLVLECVASDESEVPFIADEIRYLRGI